jgi:pimeloyl-ACP methyl ester carboxylesterase/DNA-binding CsgD family transcriptional regulator
VHFAQTRDGLKIAYAVSGKGYPLVRAGTWTSNIELDRRMSVFQPLFRELAARYRLYRYDPRGFGLSQGRDGDVNLETLVADLESVANDARLERFALWGGAAAATAASIAYAARHADRVSHLVLSTPVARGRLHATARPDERERFLAMVKLIELGWGQQNAAYRDIINTRMFPNATAEQLRELSELFRVTTSPEHAARMAMATGSVDVSNLLPRLRCPTLIVHFRQSDLVPLEEARFVASSVAHARFVPLDSPNYSPLEGEPAFAGFLAELEAFLPRAPVSPAAGAAQLTPREREVLDLVARGMANADIAARLKMSVKTVRNTVSNIFDKLDVNSRSKAIVAAQRLGFGE